MVFLKICWGITLLMSCAAAIGLVATFAAAASAPQEAAGAAMVAATCIVPYVFTRCVEGLERPVVAPVEVRQAQAGETAFRA
jgi:hypothetical protein